MANIQIDEVRDNEIVTFRGVPFDEHPPSLPDDTQDTSE